MRALKVNLRQQQQPIETNGLSKLSLREMSSMLSEVEPMDSLPFVVGTDAPVSVESNNSKENKDETSTSFDDSSKPKIPAPTIEEVDEDPESLRTLRGQGRYFGVDDDNEDDKDRIKEAVPKCSNCSQRGHLKRNCPHVICTYCGAMDDHYSKHCPKAIKCANCNENGHYRSQCPHKWRRLYCTLCNSKRHARERCPSIWRVYLVKEGEDSTKNNKNKNTIPFDKIYCYNCGDQGHFGDDCNQRRSSRVPNDDGSAFSGDNLPSKLKKKYYSQINDGKSSKKTTKRPALFDEYRNNSSSSLSSSRGSNRNNFKRNYNTRDDFNYDDYELDEAYYDDDYDYRTSNKRKRNDRNRDDSYNNKRNKPYHNNDDYYNNNNNSRNHPLDFPRSNRNNNSNTISNNMQYARYDNNNSNNNRGGRNNNRGGRNNQPNYKNYNSFKPFRSGTIRR